MEEQRRPKVLQAGKGLRLNVQGIDFTYKATSADTDGQYALAEGIVPPGHGAPTHIHRREDEAFYILKGEFEIECGGETFQAGPGTFALLPKNLPHRFQNVSQRPGRVLCVQSPGGVEEFFEHMSVFANELRPLDLTKMQELAERYGIEFLPAGVPAHPRQG
jgi:mannose-6-phosphate isomerase-like protein (cupin superfamily)